MGKIDFEDVKMIFFVSFVMAVLGVLGSEVIGRHDLSDLVSAAIFNAVVTAMLMIVGLKLNSWCVERRKK